MDKTQINFVSQGNSYLASHRMRITKPAELLNVCCSSEIEAVVTQRGNALADINVFFKHFEPGSAIISASSGPDLGFYSVFDICDDHFEREHGAYYLKMCELADAITCNSKNMQERIYKVTGKLARIIPDPITFLKTTPEIKKRDSKIPPRLLWFGHSSNVMALYNWLPKLDYKITAVCDSPINHPKIDAIQWKPMVVEGQIENHDIVLIPTTQHPWTKCKSPNRAVDAIQAGKFVITDNKEIYGDLEDFVYIINSPEELQEAIKFWNDNPKKVQEMILKGQEYISKTYSDEVILDGWLNVMKDLGIIEDYKEVVNNGI